MSRLRHASRPFSMSPGFAATAVRTLAFGLGAALAVTRLLANRFDDVSLHNPLVFLSVAGCLLAATAAACWFPARRATRGIVGVTPVMSDT